MLVVILYSIIQIPLIGVKERVDVAEWVPASEPVEPEDLWKLDPDNPGHYRKSRGQYQLWLQRIVSTETGFVLADSEDIKGKALPPLNGRSEE